MTPEPDIRWQQRLVNFSRALSLLREAMANGFVFAVVMPRQVIKDAYAAKVIEEGQDWIAMLDHRNLLSHTYNPIVFEQAVDAIQQRYLPAMERLHAFLQQEMVR